MQNKMGDRQRLLHILEAIKEIESYTTGINLEQFTANSMMRFATVKQIEIIGEAANYISQEVKDKFSEIQWSQITGMRHLLVHEYFGIAIQLVWQVILNDIPELKVKANQILSALSEQQNQ